jgi:hypothetical protein
MAAKGNSVQLATDYGRFYIIPGIVDPVPSITNILEIINKKAIGPWMAKQQKMADIEAAWKLWGQLLESIKYCLTEEFPLPETTYDQFISLLDSMIGNEKEGDKQKRAAAEIGTQAHAWIEWRCRKEMGQSVGPEPSLSDPAMIAATHFEDWKEDKKFKPVRSEQRVWSVTHLFAGTLDLLGEVEGVLSLVDIKTGKSVYDEAKLQVSAYASALDEMGMEHVEQSVILRLPKITTDPEFEAVTVCDLDYHFEAFLHARQLWQWNYIQEKSKPKFPRRSK